MLFKRYESQGLAHYSYLIADQGKATLIDPRRDIDDYLQDAARGGYQIERVLETHRNEDYIIGSSEIEAATGATIFHADGQWDYEYGQAVEDGQEWQVGRLMIRAIHTPGHTPGSMSYLLHDPDGHPWLVFTGDTLFSGDVGRMDLLGQDRLEEMAGMMYESLFEKLLPLGDQVIVCPAHGAGSVCGSEIAERTWTTIGLERRFNPKLQVGTKDEFVEQFAQMLERPPYFRHIERINLSGAKVIGRIPELTPLSPDEIVKEKANQDVQLIDTRDQVSFASAHVSGSLSIWHEILASFAGWFIDPDQPLLFVCDPDDRDQIVRTMLRIGYDRLTGYLAGGMVAWTQAGKNVASLNLYSPKELCTTLESGDMPFLLDVRGEDELTGEGLKHAKRIHLTQLPEQLEAIPNDQSIVTLCSSGRRSMTAASYLKQKGWEKLGVLMGGLEAWENVDCNIEL